MIITHSKLHLGACTHPPGTALETGLGEEPKAGKATDTQTHHLGRWGCGAVGGRGTVGGGESTSCTALTPSVGEPHPGEALHTVALSTRESGGTPGRQTDGQTSGHGPPGRAHTASEALGLCPVYKGKGSAVFVSWGQAGAFLAPPVSRQGRGCLHRAAQIYLSWKPAGNGAKPHRVRTAQRDWAVRCLHRGSGAAGFATGKAHPQRTLCCPPAGPQTL